MICWYGWVVCYGLCWCRFEFCGFGFGCGFLVALLWVGSWLAVAFCAYGIDLDFSVGGSWLGGLVLFAICGRCGYLLGLVLGWVVFGFVGLTVVLGGLRLMLGFLD